MSAVRILAIYLIVGIISLTAFETADLLADEKQAEEQKQAKGQKPLFTLSKQTTYVSGPLRKDGTVDYVAALDATRDPSGCRTWSGLLWMLRRKKPLKLYIEAKTAN